MYALKTHRWLGHWRLGRRLNGATIQVVDHAVAVILESEIICIMLLSCDEFLTIQQLRHAILPFHSLLLSVLCTYPQVENVLLVVPKLVF